MTIEEKVKAFTWVKYEGKIYEKKEFEKMLHWLIDNDYNFKKKLIDELAPLEIILIEMNADKDDLIATIKGKREYDHAFKCI